MGGLGFGGLLVVGYFLRFSVLWVGVIYVSRCFGVVVVLRVVLGLLIVLGFWVRCLLRVVWAWFDLVLGLQACGLGVSRLNFLCGWLFGACGFGLILRAVFV